MTIYQKVTEARVDLQEMKLKKSGSNQSIKYYELGDFLPAINALAKKHGFMTQFTIEAKNNSLDEGIIHLVETAVLRVVDIEVDNELTNMIIFTCPTATATLPKGTPIKELGAKITYMRRYMLMSAFEIVESDAVDKLAIDMKDAVEAKDEETIRACKNQKELSAVCNTLTKKYKQSLITPIYDEVKIKFAQNESEA